MSSALKPILENMLLISHEIVTDLFGFGALQLVFNNTYLTRTYCLKWSRVVTNIHATAEFQLMDSAPYPFGQRSSRLLQKILQNATTIFARSLNFFFWSRKFTEHCKILWSRELHCWILPSRIIYYALSTKVSQKKSLRICKTLCVIPCPKVSGNWTLSASSH